MSEPAYIVAHLKVKDFQEYLAAYGAGFIELLPRFDGELLAATQDATVLEGQSDENWTVLLRFPSRAKAEAFYNADDYAPLIKLRTETLGTVGSITLFSGMPTDA